MIFVFPSLGHISCITFGPRNIFFAASLQDKLIHGIVFLDLDNYGEIFFLWVM